MPLSLFLLGRVGLIGQIGLIGWIGVIGVIGVMGTLRLSESRGCLQTMPSGSNEKR